MAELIYNKFLIISTGFVSYFGIISIYCILGKKKEKNVSKKIRFAALIAARNEELCIENSIKSLQSQNYPKELLDIYVIPNNCSDNTEEVSISLGANIIKVDQSVNNKGLALRVAMEKLQDKYDAFVVFDADNEVNENFMLSINQTLGNGYRVAKSRIIAKNRINSAIATCYDIHFATANQFLNRARVRLGLSARVIGTGFAVKSEFIKEIGGFKTKTITEDAEFFAICASKGEAIGFCEGAIAYDEQPTDFKTSMIQRKRWMSGIMQVFNYKKLDLVYGILHKKSRFYSIDASIQFIFCYIQALLPFAILALFISSPTTFGYSLILLSIKNYIYIVIMSIIVLALEKRLSFSKNIIMGILIYPIFVFSFIPILTTSLFIKTTKWKEIKHTGINYEVVKEY